MRRVAGRNEKNPIERQVVSGLFGDQEVTPVYGIEGSAEEADPHKRLRVGRKA